MVKKLLLIPGAISVAEIQTSDGSFVKIYQTNKQEKPTPVDVDQDDEIDVRRHARGIHLCGVREHDEQAALSRCLFG